VTLVLFRYTFLALVLARLTSPVVILKKYKSEKILSHEFIDEQTFC
jgi:hypothetical protein